MVALNFPPVPASFGVGESWNKPALPHSFITQSGASRSVAPDSECRALRLCEARKRGSRNWCLSMMRAEGSVRCVWSLQVGCGGVGGMEKVRWRVGWRPVGWVKEVV